MEYHWDWKVLLSPVPTGETTYLGWLLAGLRVTVALSLTSWAIALAVGTVMGVLRTVPDRRLSAKLSRSGGVSSA